MDYKKEFCLYKQFQAELGELANYMSRTDGGLIWISRGLRKLMGVS